MSKTKDNNQINGQSASSRVDALLSCLKVPEIEIDKNKIREPFLKAWEMENGDELAPEIQYLTIVGLFIYYTHNVLDDYNVRIEPARTIITAALREWLAPELNKMTALERSSANPFKSFVDAQIQRVDEVYTWENFLLTHQRTDEKEWNYKMKRCWFAQFFVRFGRMQYIETACHFDKIPAEARADYVNLKLQNLFSKLGTSCQFTYTPKIP
ncbi:MAG: hypothetical protein A3K09_06190 [Nitrospinae bacterium RIFCSPLOWO2_12_FULL_47_7]|nr:MAG: hypothetical protein A3K09_06190 [Nitrospinae bacterium RIFCSPLOWO2_12_FULL_47_7]